MSDNLVGELTVTKPDRVRTEDSRATVPPAVKNASYRHVGYIQAFSPHVCYGIPLHAGANVQTRDPPMGEITVTAILLCTCA